MNFSVPWSVIGRTCVPGCGHLVGSGAEGDDAVEDVKPTCRNESDDKSSRGLSASVAGPLPRPQRPRGRRASARRGRRARQWAHSGRRGAGVEKLRGGRWRAEAAAAPFAFQ